MDPERELDALLSAMHETSSEHTTLPGAPGAPRAASQASAVADAHGDLAPLIHIAQVVKATTDRPYAPPFAERLRGAVLARAATRRQDVRALTPIRPTTRRSFGMPLRARVLRHTWRLWGAAAALLVVFGLGVATALAASAAPGTLLFGLRRAEQQVHVASTLDAAGRARLHVQYARAWLADLQHDAAVAQDEGRYRAALAALQADTHAAENEISHLPAGAARADVEQEVAALQDDERRDLAAMLPHLTWELRILTTPVLGDLGVTVPQVSGVLLTRVDAGQWQVVLTGSGFQPGAVLLVNGAPGGVVISVMATAVSALLPANVVHGQLRSIGIGNPDGTAAAATDLPVVSAASTPHGPPATPGGPNGGHPTPNASPHAGSPSPQP